MSAGQGTFLAGLEIPQSYHFAESAVRNSSRAQNGNGIDVFGDGWRHRQNPSGCEIPGVHPAILRTQEYRVQCAVEGDRAKREDSLSFVKRATSWPERASQRLGQ
jgi:hypothetical protein